MKVLLSGGGTAGHITPLLAVASEIMAMSPEAEVLFIGQKGDKNLHIVISNKIISKIYTVRAGKFRRFHNLSFWQNVTNFKTNLLNLRDAVLVGIGFLQSIILLVRIRPDAVFFKGGFVVVPIGCAARLLRIPYMTHDSDPIPGMANRLIAKGAKRNAVISENVRVYPPDKTVVTGVPLITEYNERRGANQEKYKKQLGIPAHARLLFVYTGTQGARTIDNALEQVLPGILDKYSDLHVAYVFGRLNEQSMDHKYANLSTEVSSRLHTMTFIDNAYDYIAAADVIIGRAGATSMAEFATIGRACIIIPAAQLTGGHQLLNAEMYGAESGAVRIVKEDQLPADLENALNELLLSSTLQRSMEEKIRAFAPENAAKNIAKEIISIAEGTKI